VGQSVRKFVGVRHFCCPYFLCIDRGFGFPTADQAAKRLATLPHPRIPLVPAAYVLVAATILIILFAYRPTTTWPGLFIVALGIPFIPVFAAPEISRRLSLHKIEEGKIIPYNAWYPNSFTRMSIFDSMKLESSAPARN